MKKLSMGAEGGEGLAPLPGESVVLKRFPLLCQFLAVTKYDDGTPRLRGRVWFESDAIAYVITLMEPTACARVRLRGASIDDTLALAEKHLSIENAPWEVDQYARDRQAMKKKK
jgi:hypothetical protein